MPEKRKMQYNNRSSSRYRQRAGGGGAARAVSSNPSYVPADPSSSSSSSSSSSCSTASKVLLYLLLLAILAALGYLLYRAIEYNRVLSASGDPSRRLHDGAMVRNKKYGDKSGKDDLESRSGGGNGGVEYHHDGEKRSMYERFENSVAEEMGDDYDGKEGRRNEDREMRRMMTMESFSEGEDAKTKKKKNNKKGSIVYFHMDGCGHCRRFDPIWKEFKSDHEAALKAKGISLESYDARDEYTQEMDVVGFPTVLFVDGKGKKADTFQGTRTVAELLRFAHRQGVNK